MSNASDGADHVAQCERRMTVAVVEEQEAHASVRFLESARIYRLPRSSPGYAASVRSLQAAEGTGVAVRVLLAAPHSEILVSVQTYG